MLEISLASLIAILQLLAIPVLYSFISITDVQLREASRLSSVASSLKLTNTTFTPSCVNTECPKSQPTVPAVPEIFFSEDLEQYFGIRLIHSTIDHNLTKEILDAHDITTDPMYNRFARLEEVPRLRYFIDNNLNTNKRLYVKYISKEKGFGCFSTLPITSGSPVVVYAGMIVRDSKSDYSWWYPGSASMVDTKTGKKLELGIDSSSTGNIARFVNHDDDPNLDIFIVPHNNRYHMVYVAQKDIQPHEELTISYGEGFWTEKGRKKDDKPRKSGKKN